jgi:tetratricopeptide (TPR) repeat protein
MKLEKGQRVIALMCRASIYDDIDEHAKAIADCDAALALDPKSSDVLYLRATIYSGAENWAATKADLDKAIAIEALPDLHELRGLAKYNLGDYAGARKDFAIAIEGNEDIEPQFHVYRGMAALLLDKPKDAIPDFTAAIERNADDVKALAQRAKAYEACGNAKAALADLDRVKKLIPPSEMLEEHRKRLSAQLKSKKR